MSKKIITPEAIEAQKKVQEWPFKLIVAGNGLQGIYVITDPKHEVERMLMNILKQDPIFLNWLQTMIDNVKKVKVIHTTNGKEKES